jgi:hypothetical protein
MVTDVPPVPLVGDSPVTVGAGGGLTVIVAVAALDVPAPVVAVYWKVSVPVKVAFGV